MRRRRAIVVFVVGVITLVLLASAMPRMIEESLPKQAISSPSSQNTTQQEATGSSPARTALDALAVKGRAPKTGYTRAQFGDGWAKTNGCSTREIILHRDLQNPVLDGACSIISGTLNDPYTGKIIDFTKDKSSAVQIDHVVALSDAWQKGAQLLTKEQRIQLANDPLELLAVDGPANQAKGDGDAATWLPQNKAFRCVYIARQIAVKVKYALWVTQPERDTMESILTSCPGETLP